WDAGVYQTASPGGRLRTDAQRDWMSDVGASDLAGATVNLLASNGTTVLATTTTDGSGLYHFTGLTPGSYVVQFVALGGYSFTARSEERRVGKECSARRARCQKKLNTNPSGPNDD